jgi:hypothetical protein
VFRLQSCPSCNTFFLFRLNIIIELAFIDGEKPSTVLLCVNNPINFLLKNITFYNLFIIYNWKELANETFCRVGKFNYKMCAKN